MPHRLNELKTAGIPMRTRTASGIMHYKLMVFAGQSHRRVQRRQFQRRCLGIHRHLPYVNYVDESVYFTNRSSFVHSFMTKFDDLWTTSSGYANYANVPATAAPELSDVHQGSTAQLSAAGICTPTARSASTTLDTKDRRHHVPHHGCPAYRRDDCGENRGVPVRVISDPQQYRDATRLWDAWNVDRMYMAGIPIKMRAHAGLNHEELVMLYGQHMSIFGSSNWTSSSDVSQEEHNCFCTDLTMFDWFTTMFDRKWNNSTGVTENSPFSPLPPNKPVNHSPATRRGL